MMYPEGVQQQRPLIGSFERWWGRRVDVQQTKGGRVFGILKASVGGPDSEPF